MGGAVTLHDGPDKAQAGQAGEVAEHFRQGDVPLLQCLCEALQRPPGVFDPGGAMPLLPPVLT